MAKIFLAVGSEALKMVKNWVDLGVEGGFQGRGTRPSNGPILPSVLL